MNRNHAVQGGLFCSRAEARLCSPVDSADPAEFAADLYGRAKRFLKGSSDIVANGGKCLVLLYPTGDVELVALSPEGCAAYEGTAEAGRPLLRRRGKIGGVQDGHNIRRGVRRWMERNADVVNQESVCLCVIREGEVLRLSAVSL